MLDTCPLSALLPMPEGSSSGASSDVERGTSIKAPLCGAVPVIPACKHWFQKPLSGRRSRGWLCNVLQEEAVTLQVGDTGLCPAGVRDGLGGGTGEAGQTQHLSSLLYLWVFSIRFFWSSSSSPGKKWNIAPAPFQWKGKEKGNVKYSDPAVEARQYFMQK